MSDAIKTSRTRFPYRNAFLGLILLVLLGSVAILVANGDYGYRQYTRIALALVLLLNHIAFQYRLPGHYGAVAKIAALTWIGIAMPYIAFVHLR